VLIRDAVLIDDAATARGLLRLLQPGLRRLAYDGIRLDRETSSLVAELEHLARSSTSAPPVAVEVADDCWLSTADASALLGVSARQVLNLRPRLQHRQVRGTWQFLRSDVLAEADARGAIGSDPKPLEVA
jgi:hypothetical protein